MLTQDHEDSIDLQATALTVSFHPPHTACFPSIYNVPPAPPELHHTTVSIAVNGHKHEETASSQRRYTLYIMSLII